MAGGAHSMNYTREQLDAILDQAAPAGLADGVPRQRRPGHRPGAGRLRGRAAAARPARHRPPLAPGALRRGHPRRTSTGRPASACTSRWRRSSTTTGATCSTARCSTTSTAPAGRRSPTPSPRVRCVSLHNDGSVSPPTPVLNIADRGHPADPRRHRARRPNRPSRWTRPARAHHRRRPHAAPRHPGRIDRRRASSPTSSS